jgi:dolichol-phosphate mannosyltransferase
MPDLSIITAFYNEQENLGEFRKRLDAVLATLPLEAEIVLVDDHSTDNSPDLARAWAAIDPRVKYVRLSRNFGSHAAYSAGLNCCTGDCAVLLAADLQDPPEDIPQLLAKWSEGYEVVWAERAGRPGEPRLSLFFSRIINFVLRKWVLPTWPRSGADFVLLDRKVIDAYNAIPEKNTSFMAMILWMGFRQASIQYVKKARHAGRSKWNFGKKVKLFLDCVVSFSYAPIRFMSMLGMLVSLLGFAYALFIVINAFAGSPIHGWSSIMVAVLVIGGFQMLMLGMLGEYLWRAFDEARGRPRYVIEEVQCGPPLEQERRRLAPANSSTSNHSSGGSSPA